MATVFADFASASLLRWRGYGKVGATANIAANRVQTHRSGWRLVVREGCVLKKFSIGSNLSGVVIDTSGGGDHMRGYCEMFPARGDSSCVTETKLFVNRGVAQI